MKTCLICQTTKPFTAFSLLPKGRDGFHPWCQECVSEYNKARYHAGKNPSRYTRKSAATILPSTPPAKTKTAERKATPGYVTADSVYRKLLKSGHVPRWSRFEDLLPIYQAAASCGMAVDHIVPLNGDDVCGLHVPWNLQLLTPSENARKARRYHQPW